MHRLPPLPSRPRVSFQRERSVLEVPQKTTRTFVLSFTLYHQGCQARGAADGARVDVP